MAINLLALEPNRVSRDLSGYITYLYGAAKVGKTTLCSKFPKTLILAFEAGTNALPGVFAQPITKWSEFKETLRELKKAEVKERFSTIVIDTLDVAQAMCEKYICNQLGIDSMGEGGWGTNSWTKYKRELEETFRSITQMGYALVVISHDQDKTFKRKDGTEYNQIVPTAQKSANNIVKDMADLYIYACLDEATKERKLILRSLDGTVDCGSRFRYMPAEIPLDYDALVRALNEAIDKEAAEHDNKYVTEERISPAPVETKYDYDALIEEFNNFVAPFMQKNPQYYAPRIVSIVEKYLGKGKKVSDTTIDQAEFIYLILGELKEEIK